MSFSSFRLISIFLFCFLRLQFASGQNIFNAQVKDSISGESLVGVTGVLKGTTNGSAADINGRISIANLPDGQAVIIFSLIGYQKKEIEVSIPMADQKKIYEILLAPESVDMGEVTVTSTRTRSRIEDLPGKIEVIGSEDLDEESAVEPENIGSILGDIAGIQWQQTSAVSGNSSIRIQGLSGKYTQILRDGLPIFEGFSGGFGVLDIPPLDLKQVEIIKGSASTLYGGGAIGGLINLISKEPADSFQTRLSINQTSLLETNLNIFSSGKNNRAGFTMYAGGTYQRAVDVDGDAFSDQPLVHAVSVHPRLFLYLNKKTTLKIGLSGSADKHKGGDVNVIYHEVDSRHSYTEENLTSRGIFDFILERQSGKSNLFTLKGVASIFDRAFTKPSFSFKASQFTSFLEGSYLFHQSKNDLVAGFDLHSNQVNIRQWNQTSSQTIFTPLPDYQHYTLGLFALDDWKVCERYTLEAGMRYDQHNIYGAFFLPHISMLTRASKSISLRLSGGMGYKVPDMFAGDDEEVDLSHALPIGSSVKAERSLGANFDINYQHLFGSTSLTLNESVFYTRIDHPVSTVTGIEDEILFGNFDDHVDSKGSETYVRVGLTHFDFYGGYVYSQPERFTSKGTYDVLLNARHKFALDGVYEIENSWKFGLESTYTGMQHVNDQDSRQGYFFVAAMIQKTIKRFLLTLNCENLLDFRQSRVEQVVIPPYNQPTFRPVWAPLEGRIINLALQVRL